MKRNTIFILFTLLFIKVSSQIGKQTNLNDLPAIGKPCPDFQLNKILHFSSKSASLSDFKGKWLILDFWGKWCTKCVESFPKLNSLQEKFQDKIQFMPIAYDEANIEQFFEKLTVKQNLHLPTAIDKFIFNQFGVYEVPHIIVIDDKGIIQAITSADSITENNLKLFLNNEKVLLTEKSNKGSMPFFDSKKPLLINNNGANDTAFIFRSILTPYINGLSGSAQIIRSGINRAVFINTNILTLFRYAYGGTNFDGSGFPFNRVLLIVNDSSKFNNNIKSNLYSYELSVPSFKLNELPKIMQKDLANLFNYTAKVKKKRVKVLVLVRNGGNLKSLGGKPFYEWGTLGIKLQNQPISQLIEMLAYYLPTQPPIIDKSNYKDKIDIALDAIMIDINDVRKSLINQGLNLKEAKRRIEVLILSDKKKTTH
jgi:thiol-disulfide isomerase/thioredoxin